MAVERAKLDIKVSTTAVEWEIATGVVKLYSKFSAASIGKRDGGGGIQADKAIKKHLKV